VGSRTSSTNFRSGPEPRERRCGQRHMIAAPIGRIHGRTNQQPQSSENPLPTESRPYTGPFRSSLQWVRYLKSCHSAAVSDRRLGAVLVVRDRVTVSPKRTRALPEMTHEFRRRRSADQLAD
jgi:hypothetical protein